jgi:class 3 adenylate cyclase/tetratricopeptide (TPR) repeat protein
MAENLDPEEWAEIMNEAFDFMIEPIYRYEGTLARMMGDGLLAFFGAPIAHEDDPQRAVMAGLDIISDLAPFRQEMMDDYDLEFNVRVGINTGPVVVGEIGSDLAVEYTAMGDAINLAARMEETASPGSVQISDHTYRLVAPLFDFEPIGPISVKGRGEAVESYRVLRRKLKPGQMRGLEGLSAPLIGRDGEYSRLLAMLEQLNEGQGHILCITGEAGLGKSRLISEMKSVWEGYNYGPISWTESNGIPYEKDRPYSQFLQRLIYSFGISPDDSLQEVRDKVNDSMVENSEEDRAIVLQAVEILLSVDDQNHPLVGAEALKNQLFESVLAAWRATTLACPTVRVFDDLHWTDPASVELISHLLQLVRSSPILFVLAMRPHEESIGWNVIATAQSEYAEFLTRINLSPLSINDSDLLVSKILAISDIPADMREIILRKADGNPFYLEEIIRELIDTQAIIRDDTGLHWQATRPVDKIEIPDNLQALLVSRIDRLEKETRRTLQIASVIGRSFYFRVLDSITHTIDTLKDQLLSLQEAEMILESAQIPELEYIFRHELTRDATYRTILHRQRRAYHKAIGEALETLMPDRLAEESHSLAHHFEQARDREKSLKYNTLAGDRAARIFANQEAKNYYERALADGSKIATTDQLIHIYKSLGRTLELSSNHEAAMARYNEMLDLAISRNDPAIEVEALMAQAILQSTFTPLFDPDSARKTIQKALPLAEELSDPQAEAKIYWIKMLRQLFSGDEIEDSVISGERSLAIAREHHLNEQLAYTLHDLGRPYAFCGRFEEAISVLSEAGELFRDQGNLPMFADNRATLSYGYLVQANLEMSLALCKEAIEASRKSGSLWGETYALNQLGFVYFELAKIDSAFDSWKRSMSIAEQANFPGGNSFARLYKAYASGHLGAYAAGIDSVDYINSLPDDSIDSRDLAEFYSIAAPLFAGIGDLSRAKKILQKAIDLDSVQIRSNILIQQFFVESQCALWLADGDFENSLKLSSETGESMTSSGLFLIVPTLLLYRGLSEIGLNLLDEAAETFVRATDFAKSTGVRRQLWPILVARSNLASTLGNESAAADLRNEAITEINFIADQISDPVIKDTFREHAMSQLVN